QTFIMAATGPNVIIILADDLGCGDMSLYDGWIKTPRIDRMAAEGVRFTDFHSNSSVCSPTRAALLTGRYQQRVGIVDVIARHLDTPGLEPTEITIPRLMKQSGYKTALFGKWHLGGETRHNPIHHGFDQFVGLLPGAGDFHSHRRWMDGTKVKEQEGYSTDIITDRSVDFIKRNKDNPFFLYVSHQAVHNPYQTPDDTVENRPKNLTKKEKRDRKRLRPKYKVMLEELDKGVGKILDTLRKLDLDENTFVFFFSDNGAVYMNPNERPYRGGKFSNYEGGHRVPAVARWPGRIKAGWTSDELIVGMDLLPTVMDIVGVDISRERKFDGISIKKHLLNQADMPDRKVFFGYEPKLGTAMRDGNWKMQTKGDVVELYDLSKDIKETTNVADKYPKRTKEMKAAIETWKHEVTAHPGVTDDTRETKAEIQKSPQGMSFPKSTTLNLHGPTLQHGLFLLEQWHDKPLHIKELYTRAFTLFEADIEASYAQVMADEQIQKICTEHSIAHVGGPMLGDVTENSVKLWMRTVKPARIEVRVMIDGKEKAYGPVETSAQSDLSGVIKVTGLAPSSSYAYRVLVDGTPIQILGDAQINTAPDDNKKVRICFGTCPHRWGLGNQKMMDMIRSREPTAMLMYGDIAVQGRNNHLGLHRADYLLRDLRPSWQTLTSSVPIYASWDDHDYFSNDRAGIPKGYTEKDRQGVRRVYTQSWNNPSYGFNNERGGIFYRTRLGPCDVIVVDNRYFRSGQKGSFLGDGQMAWLKEQLKACQGPFIILACSTMWSDYVSNGKDSWGRWDPEGREQIFKFIEAHKIPGVLLISGDRHGGRGFRIPRPEGFCLYEFESATLGGRKGPPVSLPEWKDVQLYGISNTYAFSEFTVDANLDDPEVTFRLIRVDDGKFLYEKTLKRSELTPPPSKPIHTSSQDSLHGLFQ
ncbi:MAG: sulfatase-like hydrolase/transferase, partial [Phycisphaerae bacterium]|nr:sulfatase-like hydrolase/transferase [Phycisphaerae bacterium]